MTLAEARQEEPLPLQVLVYGAEKKGVIAPGRELTSRNYTLHFEPFDTARRFDEFDGVIVFQGTFERVTHSTTWMGEGLDRHEYEKDELDKRIREFKLLYDGGDLRASSYASRSLTVTRPGISAQPIWSSTSC